MKITNIRESGSHNVLMWAIKNGANIKEDIGIQSVINDELFYLVTLEDVSFFEMFRLSQMYRDKLRFILAKGAAVPEREELNKMFPGVYTPDSGEGVEVGGLVEHACKSFFNIALQMVNDNDIIQENTSNMFVPMIANRYDVQIPVSFIDLVSSMSPEECKNLFGDTYPNSLQDIITNEVHGAKTVITMGFVRSTAVIQYSEKYAKYLQLIKYAPLKSYKGDKMYKLALLGFSKYDPVMRGEARVTMFRLDANDMNAALKRMSQLNTPLKLDVAVQLPIQLMAMLYNGYSRDDLTISYESDMADVLNSGIMMKNFVAPIEGDPNEEKVTNGIENYKARITEASRMAINAIDIAMQQADNYDVDVVGAFSILPPAFTVKAVLTIDTTKGAMFANNYDPMLGEMFEEVMTLAESVNDNISKAK